MKQSRPAQAIQDEIFRRMSAEKKIKLTSDFSMFLLQLNKLGKNYGFPKTPHKNRKNS